MQEHIKRLAVEAGLIYPDSKDGRMITEYGDYAEEITKLVQAVARECAKLADDSDYGPVPHCIGDQIRARFGLEG